MESITAESSAEEGSSNTDTEMLASDGAQENSGADHAAGLQSVSGVSAGISTVGGSCSSAQISPLGAGLLPGAVDKAAGHRPAAGLVEPARAESPADACGSEAGLRQRADSSAACTVDEVMDAAGRHAGASAAEAHPDVHWQLLGQLLSDSGFPTLPPHVSGPFGTLLVHAMSLLGDVCRIFMHVHTRYQLIAGSTLLLRLSASFVCMQVAHLSGREAAELLYARLTGVLRHVQWKGSLTEELLGAVDAARERQKGMDDTLRQMRQCVALSGPFCVSKQPIAACFHVSSTAAQSTSMIAIMVQSQHRAPGRTCAIRVQRVSQSTMTTS